MHLHLQSWLSTLRIFCENYTNWTVCKKAHCLEFLGNRKFNIIHARLRHNCSIPNYDPFRCNIVEDPSCRCGNPCENVFHFFNVNDTVATSNVNLNTFLFWNSLISQDIWLALCSIHICQCVKRMLNIKANKV